MITQTKSISRPVFGLANEGAIQLSLKYGSEILCFSKEKKYAFFLKVLDVKKSEHDPNLLIIEGKITSKQTIYKWVSPHNYQVTDTKKMDRMFRMNYCTSDQTGMLKEIYW